MGGDDPSKTPVMTMTENDRPGNTRTGLYVEDESERIDRIEKLLQTMGDLTLSRSNNNELGILMNNYEATRPIEETGERNPSFIVMNKMQKFKIPEGSMIVVNKEKHYQLQKISKNVYANIHTAGQK